MSGPPLLLANLGAEEGSGWRTRGRPAVARGAALAWAGLFPAGSRCLVSSGVSSDVPSPLDSTRDRAALDFLPEDGEFLVPWLATPEARELAERQGRALWPDAGEGVPRTHDKAFALECARALDALPEPLECIRCFDSEQAAAPRELRERVEREVAGWPEAWARRFVLKPRIGTSGRGFVHGAEGRLDGRRLENSHPRGGWILEPWLDVVAELSAQLWIGPEADPRLLGTLRVETGRSGAVRAILGRLRADGGLDSGTAWDERLRRAALGLAARAREAGFRGVCGVDALAYRAADGEIELRPIVEFNARFTLGTVALGWAARARECGRLEGADGIRFARSRPGAGTAVAAVGGLAARSPDVRRGPDALG